MKLTKKVNGVEDLREENTVLKRRLIACNLEKVVKIEHESINLKGVVRGLKDENREWKKENKRLLKSLSSTNATVQKLEKNIDGKELKMSRLERENEKMDEI